jgi:hypothetical protein
MSKPDTTLRIPGVDGQVTKAAEELTATQAGQPEWLWFDMDTRLTNFGRWQSFSEQAPYIRADIVMKMLRAQGAKNDAAT